MIFEIYNSHTKKLEKLTLPAEKEVSIYCCGVTVYDHCHVGHGRIYTLLDTLTRFLKSQNLSLKVIRNITDIDDKILKRAQEEGRPWRDIAATYAASMQKVLHQQLGCLEVDIEPKATDALPTMLTMIEKLIEKGCAYNVDGEVFFSIQRFPSYGSLSGQKLEELQDGQRVAVHASKKHPGDFTLWKPSCDQDASWDSPWGPGRPGWHIECSAMIAELVNGPLDFHLGGMDLKFPHHENEIAQSESCTGHALARCWVHGGFVTVNQEKMSKSLKNFQYLDEIITSIGRNATRYFYLSTHYRQPLELTADKLTQAQSSVRALEQTLMAYCPESCDEKVTYVDSIIQAFTTDLNTPLAIALYHEAVKSLKELSVAEQKDKALELYYTGRDLFGFEFVKEKEVVLQDLELDIQQLVAQRQKAKELKDFKESDRLRELIASYGYQVIDKPGSYELLPIKKS